MHSATLTEDGVHDIGVVQAKGSPEIHETALLGRIGALQVRLACSDREVAAAQKIRYRVFHDELGAGFTDAESRDADRFDTVCDHLLVVDTDCRGPDHCRIVGTYRLLRQECAQASGGFYSEDEFELKRLVARHPSRNFLELGRSCVLPDYRTKRTVELLWQGIWAYCQIHGIDVMTGCASFPGVWPAAHAKPLAFLNHFCQVEADWQVRAVAKRYRSMDLMPAEAVEMRSALAAMPPLIKGYLRLGARFGDGCVIDPDFRTTDVLVVLPTENITQRYINYYGADADRFAVSA